MTTTNATTYPPAVARTIAKLRAHTARPIVAATMLRSAYERGEMPEDVERLYTACVKATKSWSGIDAALRGMP